MQFSFTRAEPTTAAVDFLCIAVPDKNMRKQLKTLDAALGGVLLAAAKDQDFTGKNKQKLTLHTLGKLRAKRVCLLGIGDIKKATAATYLQLAGDAARTANSLSSKQALLIVPQLDDTTAALIARGANLGIYRFSEYLSDKGRPITLKKFSVGAEKGSCTEASLKAGDKIASGVALARDLVNLSPLQLYPETFAKRTQAMAKSAGLSAKVLNPADLKRMKMNLLLGVGQGSTRLPRLVHLTYNPSNPKDRKKAATILVGKGITFDSGGLSLKPPASMVDMKIDMGGAAAVVGAMQAIAGLKPKHPVHGIIALAENMPSGGAIRPGDVITGAAGKSVEINNTDAEGRLVLADALHYATKLKPARIIDLATLTGACMVALGNYTVGTFSNNDKLAEQMLSAAAASGEDFWRMPLTPSLRDQLNSDVADMKNTGERWGGAITAGLFLKEFVADTPWVHLDIAGPASTTKASGAFTKGGTGVGVATLVELVTSQL